MFFAPAPSTKRTIADHLRVGLASADWTTGRAASAVADHYGLRSIERTEALLDDVLAGRATDETARQVAALAIALAPIHRRDHRAIEAFLRGC